MDTAIVRLQKEGWKIKEEDKARLSPLSHSHINMLGRYQFNLPEELKGGALRPLIAEIFTSLYNLSDTRISSLPLTNIWFWVA